MVSSKLLTFITMLMAIEVMVAEGQNIPPILAPPLGDVIPPVPQIDNICNEVNCGRGRCEVTPGVRLNYVCQCDAGWKRTRFEDDETDNLHQFLPCIVPNCTLDYSCMPAAPPAPPIPFNVSFFDPCYWIYCGQGTCSRNQTYTHTCQCNPGYYNLQNISLFPCYSQCALGSDCSRLGIRVSNSSSSSPDSGIREGAHSGTQGASSMPGKFHWGTVLLLSLVMAI